MEPETKLTLAIGTIVVLGCLFVASLLGAIRIQAEPAHNTYIALTWIFSLLTIIPAIYASVAYEQVSTPYSKVCENLAKEDEQNRKLRAGLYEVERQRDKIAVELADAQAELADMAIRLSNIQLNVTTDVSEGTIDKIVEAVAAAVKPARSTRAKKTI